MPSDAHIDKWKYPVLIHHFMSQRRSITNCCIYNMSEHFDKVQSFSIHKIHLKTLSAEYWMRCSGLKWHDACITVTL